MELATTFPTQSIERPSTGASFPQRLGAQVIDLILHNVLMLVAAYGTGLIISVFALLTSQTASHFTTKLEGSRLLGSIFALVGYAAYHTICEGLHGATLGKWILRIHVLQEDGSACTLRAGLIRSLAYYIDGMLFGLIAASSMRSSALQQRYGDKWAHTVVVERSSHNKVRWPSGWRFVLALVLAVAVDGAVYAGFMWIKVIL